MGLSVIGGMTMAASGAPLWAWGLLNALVGLIVVSHRMQQIWWRNNRDQLDHWAEEIFHAIAVRKVSQKRRK